jgi:hypothetical protein
MFKHIKIFFILILLISSVLTNFAYTPQYADSKRKKPLFWNKKIIEIEISESVLTNTSNIISKEEILDVIKKSLKHWTDVADIDFELKFTNEEKVSPAGNYGDGTSIITIAQTPENILLFGEKANEISAITRVFFDRNGNITEADIVLNPIQYFSTDGTLGTFDLEATLTHEIGHLLGLGHSMVIGSSMHIHQGKNGVYNLPGFSSRSLSRDDISGIIFLYGKKNSNKECCGSIKGQITNSNKNLKTEYQVWAEEEATGRIFAGVSTDLNGRFVLGGLDGGNYHLYAQPSQDEKFYSTISIGVFHLENGDILNVSKEVFLEQNNFILKYIGFNGQLSTIAITLNKGKSFQIYLGGKDFNQKDFEISLNSPFLQINRESIKSHNYGNGLSVISFEVFVSPETVFGEYGIKIKNKREEIAYLVGGITIGEEVNPWNL